MNHLEIRRNGRLAGAVALVASVPAVAYLVRAVQGGTWVDWLLCGLLATMVLGHARSAWDARTPLLVADQHGIRMRLGRTWQGLTWGDLDQVEHLPQRGWWRDGRLAVTCLDGREPDLDRRTARHARLAARWYGAPYAVPLGPTTRVSIDSALGESLAEALGELADGRAEIVEILRDASADPATDDQPAEPDVDTTTSPEPNQAADEVSDRTADDDTQERPAVTDTDLGSEPAGVTAARTRPSLAVRLGRLLTRGADATPGVTPTDEVTPEPEPVAATPTPAPARTIRPAVRVDVPVQPLESVEPIAVEPEQTVIRETGAPAWSSSTVVLGDFAERPAVDPVIGPQLHEARVRLGLTVDGLAERTRIRPHVIEALEVDDFEPCGGDFYARGHLRTLGRVLGVDAGPLVATYNDVYADAPVDPRKVFEAELAHGSRSSLRGGGRGGPRWSVAVAAVMALVLAWSVARLVLDNSTPVASPAPGFSNASGDWQADQSLAPPVPVSVSASGGGAHVVIRDGGNAVVFKGDLAFGASQQFEISPPVRVQSSDGSLTVTVDGRDCGRLGETGESAQDVFTAEC